MNTFKNSLFETVTLEMNQEITINQAKMIQALVFNKPEHTHGFFNFRVEKTSSGFKASWEVFSKATQNNVVQFFESF